MAPETTERTAEKAEQAGAKTRETAHQGEQKAKQKASEMGKQAAEMAESQIESRKNRVADGVHTFGEALRLGAQELRQRGQTKDTEYVERLARQAEHVSETLEKKGTRQMAREVEQFARNNQAVFLSGALALGIAGARFLKSSPSDDMQRMGDGDRSGRPTRSAGSEGPPADPRFT